MKRRLCEATVAVLCSVFPMTAQTIGGAIVNQEDGKPLAGAIVRAVGEKGNTLAYSMADREGCFSIEIPARADTLRISLLGFEDKALTRPFASPLHVILSPRKEMIREAVITAHKVIEAGDTIRYNVNALKRREDVVLGDMLKRIPGIELDDYGYVKYNGQDINRFYIEGKDILENNYNLATRNLSVDSVKEVEVLENHQSYKLLRGIRTSDKAALNILLNEDAKTKVNGGAEVGLGMADDTPAINASARLSAFYVGSDFSSVDVGGFDNQGNALREPDLSLERDRSYRSQILQEKIAIQTQEAPLEEKRALFNKTWEASTVNRISFGENSSVSLTAKYGRDERMSDVWNRSVYQTSDAEDRILDRTEDTKARNERFISVISFKNNGSVLYVADRLYADYSRKRGVLSVMGDTGRLQDMEGKSWNVENDASLYFRIGDRIVSMDSFSQLSGLKEGLDLDGGLVGQQRDVHQFYQRFAISGISRQLGWWRFSLTPEADFSVLHSLSVLAPFPTGVVSGVLAGNTDITLFRPALAGSLQYKKSPLEAILNGEVRHSLFGGLDGRRDLTTGGLSARFKYVSGRWEASLSGGLISTAPDIQTLGSPLILTGYYTLWKGREKIASAPQWNLSGEYLYRAPVSGWNFLIKSNFMQGRSFVSARNFYDGYVLDYLTDERSRFKTLVSGMELSRGIYRLNGKWTIRLDHAWSQTAFFQDRQSVVCQVQTLSPAGSITFSPTRWWGITADFHVTFSSVGAQGFETQKNRSFTMKMKHVFHFSGAWSGGIGTDLYHFVQINKTMVFPDLAVTWTNKGLRLRVEADNLLNLQSYSFVSFSPLLTNTFSYRIRPLTVLFGADWRF